MTENCRKRRGHSRFVVFFVLILLFLCGLTYFGYKWLCVQPWLNIKTINIVGNDNVSNESIQTLMRSFENMNLVQVSSKNIRKQILKIIRIEKVGIVRIYPRTLKIKISERKGFLYLKSGEGDLYPINRDRLIMEHSIYPSREDLPIVHTQIPNKSLVVGRIVEDDFLRKVINLQNRILKEKPDFLNNVSEYYESNGAILIVDSRFGSRILLGSHCLDEQLRRYQFVQENNDVNRQSLFDLRFKDQIVVRQEVQ